MKKNFTILLCVLTIFLFLTSCKAKDDELECVDIKDITQLEGNYYLFVYKTTCEYCHKDYFYVNQYNSLSKDVPIYSYNLENGELSIEIEGVPSLIKCENDSLELVATGYLRVKKYLNNLIES